MSQENQDRVPEWVRLLPLGTVELSDGRQSFQVDPESLDNLVQGFNSRGIDLVVDYEHQTLAGGKAPAAAWITELEARADGLWARFNWTERGREFLRNREYRYFSPVLRLDPDTRRPINLMHVALTNVPAIRNLAPLVLRAGAEEEGDAAQLARAEKYGITPKRRGHVSRNCTFSRAIPEEFWGDPVNWRYPVADVALTLMTLGRWLQGDDREDYTPEEWRFIGARIRRQAEKFGVTMALADGEEARAAQAARARRYGIAVKEGGHLAKPGEWESLPDSQWGDPVNWRYPLPDAAHARNALSRWGDAANRRQYSEEEQQTITIRTRRRARALGIQATDEEEAKAMIENLKNLLGITGEKDEAEVLALVDERLKGVSAHQEAFKDLAGALDLEEGATPGQIKGAILALKQAGDRLGAVETELAALKDKRIQDKAAQAVEEALKAGKLQPSQKDWALDYALKDLPSFEVYVAQAYKVVPYGQELKVVPDKKREGLEPDAQAVCKQLGIQPEAFKAEQERLQQADA